MNKPKREIQLPSLDDLFSSEEQRQAKKIEKEKVIEIDMDKIFNNPNNPFQIRQDEEMEQMIESVKEYGILNPLIVRPKEDETFEIVAGHRRTYAGKFANLEKLPCIVRKMTDDEAAIILVDSNLQREHILPSERAKAYKMKYEAIKRQVGRPNKNVPQIGAISENKRTSVIIAEEYGESKNQIHRYIKLNELIPQLLQMLDEKKIGFSSAYELSFLSEELQTELLDVMDQEQNVPSLSQAQRLKKAAQENKLDRNGMELVMQEEKPIENKLVLKGDKLSKYFPSSYTPKQKETVIFKALDLYFKQLEKLKKAREQER